MTLVLCKVSGVHNRQSVRIEYSILTLCLLCTPESIDRLKLLKVFHQFSQFY